jgi:hypothetical protein
MEHLRSQSHLYVHVMRVRFENHAFGTSMPKVNPILLGPVYF